MSQAEGSERVGRVEQVEKVPKGFAERGWTIRSGGRDDFPAVVEVVGEALVIPDERATSVSRTPSG